MAIAVPAPDRVVAQEGAAQVAISIAATQAATQEATQAATQAGETEVAILIAATQAGATQAGATGVAILIAETHGATEAGETGAAILIAATHGATQAESGTDSGAIMIAMNETKGATTVIAVAGQTFISASAPAIRTGQPTVTAMDIIRATTPVRHAVTMTAGVTGAPTLPVITATTTATTTVIRNAVCA